MLYLVHTPNGEIIRCGVVPKNWVNQQASGDECLLTEDDVSPSSIQQVIDQGNKEFYVEQREIFLIPPSPHEGCTFNYQKKLWDAPSQIAIEEMRSMAAQKINQARLKMEALGFEYNGKRFDSSAISQLRINTAAFSALGNKLFEVDWKLADNSLIKLDALEIQQVAQAMWTYLSDCHTQSQQFKHRLSEADTSLAINSVLSDVEHWTHFSPTLTQIQSDNV